MRTVLVALGIAITAHSAQTVEDGSMTYGFRYDPMRFVEENESLQAARVRETVFDAPREGDRDVIDAAIAKAMENRREDGTFADTSKDTGSALLELLRLGHGADSPAIRDGLAAMMDQYLAGKNADEWYEKDGALNIYPLNALLLGGMEDAPEAAMSLRWLAAHPDSWVGPNAGCPWTPEVFVYAVWDGRDVEDVDDTLAHALTWMRDSMNDAGQITYKDPWGFVSAAGYVDHPVGREIVVKLLPLILRGQQSDGGWGHHSLSVFRALVRYDLLDALRAGPPLPPDWRVTESVPLPEGSAQGLAWDGEAFWTRDPKENRAVRLDATTGGVLRSVALREEAHGLAYKDGNLVVTARGETSHVVILDADSGGILQDIPTPHVDWIGSVAAVNGHFLVADTFNGCVAVVDPDKPEQRTRHGLAGGGPGYLAATDDGVWHADYWSPLLIKSDHGGGLLEWAGKPFGGNVGGIAWDGQRLWAIDSGERRICAIERIEAN
ncbi:hypothetical protein CMK11_09370 [Candidatus Poribacteria bacterium]|nr:hypothetical protein [Candidatus Poribacteria bacterium]